jgi:flagellar biogenesis protein FliO
VSRWRKLSGPLAVLAWPVLARAADATPVAPEFAGPSLTVSLLRLAGGLIFVFAILFGGAWLVRNSRRLVSPNARAPKLAVLEMKSLGQRQALYVIGYEQQRMLVASSPAGCVLLANLPAADPAEAAQVRTSSNFAEVLIQAVTRKS